MGGHSHPKSFLFIACYFMQHFLYFFPLPQKHGSFLPIFSDELRGAGI
jgi:hypothetical protein